MCGDVEEQYPVTVLTKFTDGEPDISVVEKHAGHLYKFIDANFHNHTLIVTASNIKTFIRNLVALVYDPKQKVETDSDTVHGVIELDARSHFILIQQYNVAQQNYDVIMLQPHKLPELIEALQHIQSHVLKNA